MHPLRTLTLGLLCLQLLFAQQASEQPSITIRTTTRLVQISVVVHDKHGEPVRDLKKEDFLVTEKGRPQMISVFSMESSERPSPAAPKLPPNIFSNRLSQRTGVLNTVTVILFDALNTSWEDQVYARKQVIKFLKQLRPEDHVAIYSLGRGLRILHDYTTDSSELLARLNKFTGENLPDLSASEIAAEDRARAEQAREFGLNSFLDTQMEADFYTTQRVLNTLRSLEVIATHLSGIPGRKNLIWVSGGFPLQIGFDEIPEPGQTTQGDKRSFSYEVDAAVRALNNAGVAVYPVDARGLVIGADFKGASYGGPINRAPTASLKPTVPNLDSMIQLAERTGGRAAYNTNDLEHAVEKAMNDSRVTYTIGYYPEHDADGRFHDIKVKVNRPGLNVRYRKGYFSFRDADRDAKVRSAEMQNAVWSPLDATAVGVNTRVDLIDKPEPNTLNIIAQIDPSNISFTHEKDRYVAKVDILFVQKDDQGHLFGKAVTDTLDLALLPATYQKVVSKGLLYEKRIPREGKATRLKMVARDIPTGAIGSITVPLKDVRPFSEVVPPRKN